MSRGRAKLWSFNAETPSRDAEKRGEKNLMNQFTAGMSRDQAESETWQTKKSQYPKRVQKRETNIEVGWRMTNPAAWQMRPIH